MAKFRTPEARNLMAFTLALDPTMSEELRKFFRMGALVSHLGSGVGASGAGLW